MTENNKKQNIFVKSIAELTVVIGLCLFLYSVYTLGKDYLNLNKMMETLSFSNASDLEQAFNNFEGLITLSLTKLIPMSLVLISAGCLIAKNLLTGMSRVFVLSFSVTVILLSAFFLGSNFELVCAEQTGIKSLGLDIGALGNCFSTIFPVGILIFTTLLIMFKNIDSDNIVTE